MNLFAIPPFITSVLILMIGTFVIFQDYRSKVNQVFSLFAFASVHWLFAYSMMYASTDPVTALYWARIGFAGILLIPIFAFNFVVYFLNRRVNKYLFPILYIIAVPSIIIGGTDLVYKGMRTYFWGYYPTAGKLYIFYVIAFFSLFVSGAILLLQEYLIAAKNNQYLRSQQIKYMLIAFGGGTLGVIDYIIKYQVPIYPFGYLCGLFFISVLAYAMVTYRLMDIQVILRKGAVYSVVTAVMSVLYYLIIYTSEAIFAHASNTNKLFFTIPAIFLLAALFAPIKDLLQTFIDRTFFRSKYEAEQIVSRFSQGLKKFTTPEEFARYITRTARGTFKLKWAACFIYNEDKDEYICLESRGEGDIKTGAAILRSNSMIIEMMGKEEIIYTEELRFKLNNKESRDRKGIETLLNDMEKMDIFLCVPSVSENKKNKLLGFLAAGEKINKRHFSGEEIETLETLANQTAIGIENSLLYKQQINTVEKSLKLEKLASLGSATAGVAHEAKNALAYIRSFSQLIPIKADSREFMDKAAIAFPAEVQRIKLIMQGILDFSSPTVLKVEEVNIKELVQETIVLVRDSAKGKNVEISDITDANNLIMADRNSLKQVLLNMFMNSIDAIQKGGSLTIESKNANNKIVLSVADTGSGMSQEVIDKIFDPFFTTKEHGTGLGLAIVKRLIEENQGTLKVLSKVGEGTMFVMEFPSAVAFQS